MQQIIVRIYIAVNSIYGVPSVRIIHFLQIKTNGIILLFKSPEEPRDIELRCFRNDPSLIKNCTFFAPFYGNIDTSDTIESNGTCYSKTCVTDDKLLNETKAQIQRAGDRDFSPKYLLIATWDYQNDQVH